MITEPVLALLLILSAGSYLLLGFSIIALKRGVGAIPVGLLFIVVSVWVAGGAVELLATSLTGFSIGRTGHFVGTALVPIVALAFFREYTQSRTRAGILLLLCIIPVVSIFLAATNAQHELMWTMPFANAAGEFLTRPERWGPWFLFVHLPYSYLVIGAAIISLIVHSSAVAPAQRRSLFLLTACCVVPLSATLAYDLGIGSDTVSYVPFVFAAMLPAYAWVLFVEKVIEFSPLPYETVFQNMQDAVIVVDNQRRIISLNHGAETMLSVTESDALRKSLQTVLGSRFPEASAALDSGHSQRAETDSGNVMHIQVSPIQERGGSSTAGQVLIFRDVSDVEKARSEVQNSEKLLQTIIDHSANGIVRFRWLQVDDDEKQLRAIFANAAAGSFLDADTKSIVGMDASRVIRLATAGMERPAAREIAEQFDAAVGVRNNLDVDVKQSADGEGRWLRMICEPVARDFAVTFVETTHRKEKELQMETIAALDALTGVFNRRGFEGTATQRLAEGGDDGFGALLFIDLNGFKQINDRSGHEVGDEILRKAAKRLGKALRGDDVIGRPGGDEFVALVPEVDATIAEHLALRLTTALDRPYVIGDQTLHCPASIGLALYPKNATTLTGLLREADQAMYRAKARTRDLGNTSANDLLEKAN